MVDEDYRSIGWPTIVVAAIEAISLLLWIVPFAADTRLTSEQFRWYVELPLAFLVAPALAILAAWYLGRSGPSLERSCLVASVLWVVLLLNFIVFFGYALVSRG